MTTICLALLALAPLAATGQKDTAAAIVDRYVELLGYTRLPQDSMLTMVTTVTSPGTADTFVMKRWFVPPLMMRVEVWQPHLRPQTGILDGIQRLYLLREGAAL